MSNKITNLQLPEPNEQNIDNLKNSAITGALFETVSRHGDASAEFLKGLRGVDNQTGQVFDRSLEKIAQYKLDGQFRERNIQQQQGFSAEIASVSKQNAEAMINRSGNRVLRSEDVAAYGKNHKVVDLVELLDGQEISTTQMKFSTNPEEVLKKIARGDGSGKQNDWSRYMEVDKLSVPSEQVELMKEECRNQVKNLRNQVANLRETGDPSKITEITKLERAADNYQKLESKITDSGISMEEARRYRLNPKWETAKDIGQISHRAGLEGAKFGAAIGGSISAVGNALAVYSGDKELGVAIQDALTDTLKSAGLGYGTAFVGSTVKGTLQQSSNLMLRNVAKTGLPAAIVSVTLTATQAVKRYVNGEIDGEQLAHEMGVTVTGMLSASMFTALGQVAIPIPVLGGLIGGMVGYAITNSFYRGFVDVLKEAKLSAERRQMVEMQCEIAISLARQYELGFKELFEYKATQLQQESTALFALLDNPNTSADELCAGMNQFAEIMGQKISINNMTEFDEIMLSDDVLKI